MAEASEMTPLERARRALIDELRRQASLSGCVLETDGHLAQVSGSFALEPLVQAVATAIRETSEPMIDLSNPADRHD